MAQETDLRRTINSSLRDMGVKFQVVTFCWALFNEGSENENLFHSTQSHEVNRLNVHLGLRVESKGPVVNREFIYIYILMRPWQDASKEG